MIKAKTKIRYKVDAAYDSRDIVGHHCVTYYPMLVSIDVGLCKDDDGDEFIYIGKWLASTSSENIRMPKRCLGKLITALEELKTIKKREL